MTPVKTSKKLIEVALPLEAINVASARDKSIRYGDRSTLHPSADLAVAGLGAGGGLCSAAFDLPNPRG